MVKYITRRKAKGEYQYFYGTKRVTDESEIERINKLAIPPAWADVRISRSQSAKVQVQGYDASGRQQSIYHPEFRLQQDALKFDRILRFAKKLPTLREQIEKDLARKRLVKQKVIACIVTLIDEAYFRVGNDRYATEHQTYGVTTLRSKHATVKGSVVVFDFVGKSGKQHHKKISDPKLARIIKQLDELPGYEIFRYQDNKGTMHDLHASDVNRYIKQHMGEEFTAKDFRTWGGTLLATSAIIQDELKADASQRARKKQLTAIVKRVAKKLGNTPAIARGSYIDPRVIEAYEDGVSVPKLKKAMTTMRPRKYLSVDEQCVLKLLQK
ncbi:MAG: DNA topoisomerase IB [Candidatus Microsaccharimonas sp.]